MSSSVNGVCIRPVDECFFAIEEDELEGDFGVVFLLRGEEQVQFSRRIQHHRARNRRICRSHELALFQRITVGKLVAVDLNLPP